MNFDFSVSVLLWMVFPFVGYLAATLCVLGKQMGGALPLLVPRISFWAFLFWYILLWPISFTLITVWIASLVIYPGIISGFRHQALVELGEAPSSWWEFTSIKFDGFLFWQLKMPPIAWAVFGAWTLLFILAAKL